MKMLVFIVLLFSLLAGNVFANDYQITVEITGVTINGGNVIIAIYSNENNYKRDIPFRTIILNSQNTVVSDITTLPEGYYLFAVYQDTNNNNRLDTNLFGFPKEPAGLSNYNGGIPGGFNRHRVLINGNNSRIVVNIGNV